jgi:hypothetical protein
MVAFFSYVFKNERHYEQIKMADAAGTPGACGL